MAEIIPEYIRIYATEKIDVSYERTIFTQFPPYEVQARIGRIGNSVWVSEVMDDIEEPWDTRYWTSFDAAYQYVARELSIKKEIFELEDGTWSRLPNIYNENEDMYHGVHISQR